jgi:hypothetical protein
VEKEMQNVTMLLCTMAGIVERIRKERIAHDVAFAGPSLACMQMLHTSSVNLLFLPESKEAGVSLLANVAV